jgi:hypothetical protein
MKNILRIFGILVLAVFVISFTQSRTITGKVTDESGYPLPGVTVTVTVLAALVQRLPVGEIAGVPTVGPLRLPIR